MQPRIDPWIDSPWRRDHGGKARGLVGIEGSAARAVIPARRRLAAIHTVAPFDDVQVDLDDPFLGEILLHPINDHGLSGFPDQALAGGEEQILRELLGDRAAAAGIAALFDVGLDRFDDRVPVDALVSEEIRIFGGEDRVDEVLRDRAQGHSCLESPRLVAGLAGLAVPLPHDRGLLRQRPCELAHGGARRQPQENPGGQQDRPDKGNQRPSLDDLQETSQKSSRFSWPRIRGRPR